MRSLHRLSFFLSLVLLLPVCGCIPPSDHLTFPMNPVRTDAHETWYDVHAAGRADFALHYDDSGRVTELWYDDTGSGKADRVYRLADYKNEDVPHLVLLLDSIPYQSVADRYAAGDFRFFDPPRKVIAPFPSLTELCFSQILHCPPLPGVVDDSFDTRTGQMRSMFFNRLTGYIEPWERRLHYTGDFYDEGLSFLNPDPWYRAELERARKAFDDSPDRVSFLYIGSAASMVCINGTQGVKDVLDQAQQFCLQVLYERRGAVKISMMADHGHNLMLTSNLSLDDTLTKAGLHVSDRLVAPNDVVLEVYGLVTYCGLRTHQPARVAAAVVTQPHVQLAIYQAGDQVIVRDAKGSAAIEYHDNRYRYRPIDRDVLDYRSVMDALRAEGKMDADGWASDRDWFQATVDHQWPDVPHRLWQAFHTNVYDPPEVMVTIDDGYSCGLAKFESMVTMKSTHAALNQVNSATFLLTMTGRLKGPLRSSEVLPTIEPGLEPRVLR